MRVTPSARSYASEERTGKPHFLLDFFSCIKRALEQNQKLHFLP